MDRDGVAAAYDRWAPVYDIVFGPVFRQGRRAAVIAAERIGGHILEVGVGTGLSLTDYAKTSRVAGIDIAETMLDKARERVRTQRLDNVEALEVMDAEHLTYADASFDVVVAQYVVTAIPESGEGAGRVRACRAAGRRDHPHQPHRAPRTGLRGTIEKWLMPLTSRLGWRTEFPWDRYVNAGPRHRARSASWSGARCRRSAISG